MADLIPVKIRELPAGASLSNAGVEAGTGDADAALSVTVPAALAEVTARSYLLSRTTAAPPVSPDEFDRYYVPASAVGAWAAKDGLIAEWLLLPNAGGDSTGAWYFTAALGLNFIEDEGVVAAFGAAGAASVSPAVAIRSANANFAVAAGNGIIRVDASGGAITCTLARALGTPAFTRVFTVERDSADASSNQILIKDDLGALRGAIVSPVAAGQVPWLDCYADGTKVTCRGVP